MVDGVGVERGAVECVRVECFAASCLGGDRCERLTGALPVWEWQCEDGPAEESVIPAACRFGDEGKPRGRGRGIEQGGEGVCVHRVVESDAVAGVEWDGGGVRGKHGCAESATDVGPDHAPAECTEEVGAKQCPPGVAWSEVSACGEGVFMWCEVACEWAAESCDCGAVRLAGNDDRGTAVRCEPGAHVITAKHWASPGA